jgi:predicted acylesterase/phospholipase RssA
MKVPSHTIAVFSGGGVKGAAYGGVLQALREQHIDYGARCPKLQTVVGCSIGSMIALCIVLGYTSSELQRLIDTVQLHEFLTIEPLSIFSGSILGLDDGTALRSFLTDLIRSKLACDVPTAQSLTLKSLSASKKMELHIAVTDMSNIQRVMLTPTTHPSFRVVDAVYASCALPPVFAPVEVNSILYADGGIVDNYPISEYEPSQVLGFRLQSGKADAKEETEQLMPIFKYIQSVLQISGFLPDVAIWYALPQEARRRTVSIYCEGITSMGVQNLSEKKAKLTQLGYKAMQNAIQAWSEDKMPEDRSTGLAQLLPNYLRKLVLGTQSVTQPEFESP